MRLLALSAAFIAASVAPAYAYLDPGTGSMVLQAIIGGIAVAGATVSIYWSKLKSMIASMFSRRK